MERAHVLGRLLVLVSVGSFTSGQFMSYDSDAMDTMQDMAEDRHTYMMHQRLYGGAGAQYNTRTSYATQQRPTYQNNYQSSGLNTYRKNTNAYGGNTNAYGGNTNAYGGNNNAYGGNTNAYGGNNNAYGGNTNAYGGNTNAYGGNTNAYGGNTNAYGGNTNAYRGNTNAYRGNTNAYGGNTNAYRGNAYRQNTQQRPWNYQQNGGQNNMNNQNRGSYQRPQNSQFLNTNNGANSQPSNSPVPAQHNFLQKNQGLQQASTIRTNRQPSFQSYNNNNQQSQHRQQIQTKCSQVTLDRSSGRPAVNFPGAVSSITLMQQTRWSQCTTASYGFTGRNAYVGNRCSGQFNVCYQ